MKTKSKMLKYSGFYALIFKALNLLVKGKESQLLLFNLWGPHGTGKTYALNQIKKITQELDYIKVIGPFDLSEKNRTLLDKIFYDAKGTGQSIKKIILLDGLKSIVSAGHEDEFIYDVEDRLIGPVLSTGEAIVVVASLHEIKQWRSLEVRSRHKTILMPPITSKSFREAVKAGGLDYSVAIKKTMGHPKLLEWLIENPSWDMEELDRKALDYFLNGLEPETKKIAQVMSLSYSFNIPSYQTTVKIAKINGDSSYFGDLKKIKELASIGLVTYESSTGMYHFSDPLLRGVLARSFRREFPGFATEIYVALAELSEREATFINSLSSRLLNLLYYQVWVAKLRGSSFLQWIEKWLYSEDLWKITDWQQVGREIKINPSSKYILDEIKKIAGQEAYTKIMLKIRPNRSKR